MHRVRRTAVWLLCWTLAFPGNTIAAASPCTPSSRDRSGAPRTGRSPRSLARLVDYVGMGAACKPAVPRTRSSARTRFRAPIRVGVGSAGPGTRAIRRSRDLRPTSASIRAARSGSRSTPTRRHTGSTSIAWGTTAGGSARAQGRRRSPTPCRVSSRTASASATGLVDCGNWSVSASWAVPADRGVGHLYRQAGQARHRRRQPHRLRRARRRRHLRSAVPDVRHDVAGVQRLRRQQSVQRVAGGTRLQGQLQPAAHRRAATGGGKRAGCSAPNTRWCAGSRPTATTSATRPASTPIGAAQELLEHKVFLSVGHDEYWSGAQRANVEAARDAGVHLAFFSGNEVFWKTRWETSIDGSGTPIARWSATRRPTRTRRSIPSLPEWTGTWRDPRPFNPSRRRLEAGERADRHDLHGQRARATTRSSVPAPSRQAPVLAQHDASPALPAGAARFSPTARSGYEWDEDLDNGFRPAGLLRLSSTTRRRVAAVPAGLWIQLRARHGDAQPDALPRPRAARSCSAPARCSGRGVSTSTTIAAARRRASQMQQATVNLFGDMGVAPRHAAAGLVARGPSVGTRAPDVDDRRRRRRASRRSSERQRRHDQRHGQPTTAALSQRRGLGRRRR